MANRLAHESSPYLLQHADNPVDWYPWGEEALAKAKTEDRPIFLSIGYSACHWCHVMAHESFADERVAAILNTHLVSIKVDREERPDLDRIYMGAVQAMTGRGGWPMSVFLTPEGIPFYGGTYFPPAPRYGMPSFAQVLHAIVEAWQNRRDELVASGQKLVAAIQRQGQADAESTFGHREPGQDTLHSAFRALRQSFDRVNGGWDQAPKFPQPMALEFLLRYYHSTGNTNALEMVNQTLEAMARGGIYDQLGGGFHRYSVDDHWLVPHFEKMLCDSAQLARVYLHAWQVTGNSFYRTIVEETLDYVVREMADPQGGFYAAQDADSEGEEGRFYLWTAGEIRAVLGDQVAGLFIQAYGVTEEGNASAGSAHGFEGQNVLELKGSLEEREALAGARRMLFAARERRTRPGRDEKVLASWNGLMLAAFAEAARALDRQDYRQVAERNADFLLRELKREGGRLWHTWRGGPALEAATAAAGKGGAVNGFLEDYAYLAEGLIELYQTTFDPRWYQAARELAEAMIAHFRAPGGGFFDTSDDHEALVTRPRELQDNAVPSGNAMAAYTLLRLGGLAVEPRYTELAWEALRPMQSLLARYPLGFGQWLVALAYALAGDSANRLAVAIVGDPHAGDTRALLRTCTGAYRPHQILAAGAPGTSAVPLLQHRAQIAGQATAYVCIGTVCYPPVTGTEELAAMIEGR